MHYEDPKNIHQTIEVIKLDQVQLRLPRNSTQQSMLFSQMVLSWSSFIQIGKPSLCQQSGKKPKIFKCLSIPGLPSESVTLNGQATLTPLIADLTLVDIFLRVFLRISRTYLEVTRLLSQTLYFRSDAAVWFFPPPLPPSADYITTAYD